MAKSIPFRIPDDILHKYPHSKEHQCQYFRSTCAACTAPMQHGELVCKACGAARSRCTRTAVPGKDCCKIHTPQSQHTAYQAIAGKIFDLSVDEFMETADRGIEHEFMFAKLAVAKLMTAFELTKESPDELIGMAGSILENIERFMKIAEKRRKLQEGQDLDIKLDDKVLAEIQKRTSDLVRALDTILVPYVQSPEIRKSILSQAFAASGMSGQSITPEVKDQIYRPGEGRMLDS